MKHPDRIEKARERLCERLLTPGLSPEHHALLAGMLNAICWVMDSEHSSTMELVLGNDPMAIGEKAKVANAEASK